jgi:two-component system response regulator NreC
MLEAGAAGYLLKKDATSRELMVAIRSVHENGVYLHPSVSRWLIQERLAKRAVGPGDVHGLPDQLTAREREVFMMVADGRSNQEIGELLRLSPATIQTHRANIMQKLGLHSRTELVKYALKRGLIHLEE